MCALAVLAAIANEVAFTAGARFALAHAVATVFLDSLFVKDKCEWLVSHDDIARIDSLGGLGLSLVFSSS